MLVSRTLVSADDPHFAEPTKPIGRYLNEAEAANLIAHGQTWQDRGQQGWRRIVASPEPVESLDAAAALFCSTPASRGLAGGGGIPVVRDGDGVLAGVEAVIDKDLTAALLAGSLAPTPAGRHRRQRRDDRLGHAGAAAAERGHGRADARPGRAGGTSAAAAMGPKVEAACRFAAGGGRASSRT